MTPANLHAAVLAALNAAESAERAASPAPWSWHAHTDEYGTHDTLMDTDGDRVTTVWLDGDRAGLVVLSDDQRMITALRNTAAAMLAGVRDIVERHYPYDDRPSLLGTLCHWCSAQEGQIAYPCVDYQAAARMIPNLKEVANALGHRP